jgi:ATP-binding cassette subfamily B protein
VVIAGALFMLEGHISSADFVAYLLFVSTLIASIRRIVEFTEQFQRGMTGIERFCEIMDTEPEIQNHKNAEELGKVEGNVSFRDVSFRYETEHQNVLTKLSLEVKAGESVALVGPSGGGKTTLCSLIPRFYEVTDGSILIDGKDIRSVTLDSLRENIGVVQQDVYLFSGSIRENIAYGKPGATDEEIREAARLAGADGFIADLPRGYETPLTRLFEDDGIELSGGQWQKLSVARAFYKNSDILILDEPTASLDAIAEKEIFDKFTELSHDKLTVFVSHRLSSAVTAGKIVVLRDGKIVEIGTHKELMEREGDYHYLFTTQAERYNEK